MPQLGRRQGRRRASSASDAIRAPACAGPIFRSRCRCWARARRSAIATTCARPARSLAAREPRRRAGRCVRPKHRQSNSRRRIRPACCRNISRARDNPRRAAPAPDQPVSLEPPSVTGRPTACRHVRFPPALRRARHRRTDIGRRPRVRRVTTSRRSPMNVDRSSMRPRRRATRLAASRERRCATRRLSARRGRRRVRLCLRTYAVAREPPPAPLGPAGAAATGSGSAGCGEPGGDAGLSARLRARPLDHQRRCSRRRCAGSARRWPRSGRSPPIPAAA